MRKPTRNLVLLAVVTAALGAAVLAQVAHEHTWLQSRRLTDLDLQRIERLDIRCASCPTRRFQRRGGSWHMLEPYPLPASAQAISHLLAIAHAPVRSWSSMQAYDAARLGLSPPVISLTLNSTRIDVGGEDPIEHDRYVRVGRRLARVPDRFSARLFESPLNELDRHLLAGDSNPTSVVVGDKPPDPTLIRAWRGAMAAGIRPATTTAPATAIPIRIELAQGDSIRFDLFRNQAGYVARRRKPALDYLLDEAQAQALLGKVR